MVGWGDLRSGRMSRTEAMAAWRLRNRARKHGIRGFHLLKCWLRRDLADDTQADQFGNTLSTEAMLMRTGGHRGVHQCFTSGREAIQASMSTRNQPMLCSDSL